MKRWGLIAGLFLLMPQAWAQHDRLAGIIHDADRVPLRGSVHPLATPEFDLGPVSPNMQLKSMLLGLRKTKEQQAELDRLLTDLQDPNSPGYHRWLTPDQYAERFGISPNDIDKITAWLELGGFRVRYTARGRGLILFTGTAADVERALRVPIHRFRVNGKEHYAPAGPPLIPREMADLVIGIHGLDDFKPTPRPRSQRIGTLADLLASPQVQDGDGNNLLVPDDLAAIYDLASIYKAGYTGAGQSIAVTGASDVDMTDIEGFRSALNLPDNDPQVVLADGSDDPGEDGAEDEADLDLEWAGAIAPKAKLIYVVSEDYFYSSFYAIDQAVAPVVSSSFGLCEWHLVADDFDLLRNYSQQAAAEGITWVASSGDSGAAGCEGHGGPWTFATTRMSVQAPSSLPEVTAVGGTEFNEGNGTYWASKPGPNGGTASSYIPETVWNDEDAIIQNLGQGVFETEGSGFAAAGGGASMYWDKPVWQSGPGVPKDGSRDVPDISLTASGSHDPYLLVSGGSYAGGGGTSASAPAFAGMLALLNQYLVATKALPVPGLGNINPMLYYLGQNYSAVYHDITTGSNQVPCMPGSTQDCGKSGVYGYKAGPGYDLATGWGSVDAAKLFSAWATVVNQTARLVVTKFTLPATASVGGQVSLVVAVQNQGKADAGAFEVAVLFTTDGTSATAKSWTAHCSVTGLSAGKTYTCSGTVTLDKSITAGVYYPLAVADYNQQVTQYDRTGNYGYLSGDGTMTIK